MRDALRRLQLLAERRLPALTRYRRPEPLPIQLNRRRIYIVPSGFGLGFTVLLGAMLAGALNYSNNAALLLTCLLGAASAASMLVAFRDLNGLRLTRIRAGQALAGQPMTLTLEFEATGNRQAIRLDLHPRCSVFCVEAGHASVPISLATEHRGWLSLPRMRVWSSWPWGMFRVWSWIHPQQQVLVWPRPEVGGPPPPRERDPSERPRLNRGDDLASLREYRSGDPMRHVAWKASARHHGLLVKDFEQPETGREWQLDWRQMPGLGHEMRIARMARWVGEAKAQGRRYSLWLPTGPIEAGSGAAHYARCMSALAVMP